MHTRFTRAKLARLIGSPRSRHGGGSHYIQTSDNGWITNGHWMIRFPNAAGRALNLDPRPARYNVRANGWWEQFDNIGLTSEMVARVLPTKGAPVTFGAAVTDAAGESSVTVYPYIEPRVVLAHYRDSIEALYPTNATWHTDANSSDALGLWQDGTLLAVLMPRPFNRKDRTMMSRKHYNAIAEQFRVEYEACERSRDLNCDPPNNETQLAFHNGAVFSWENMVRRIANVLAADNPRFDHERFLAACRPNTAVHLGV